MAKATWPTRCYPLLGIPKQSLHLAIDTSWYLVQLLVPVGLFTPVIPHTLLAYCLWHNIYAFLLPLVSQGTWMSFYSTRLHLPFGYSPGFISLSLLVSQLGQSLLVVDLESTAIVLSYEILSCSVPMHGNSSLLPFFLCCPILDGFLKFALSAFRTFWFCSDQFLDTSVCIHCLQQNSTVSLIIRLSVDVSL